ncbi:sodium/hydrogen exchanger 3 protein [Besnoitia besnoiti]|uniref:Sodium/hydrogen exchanger 3 protein n=1 Tax=Besnoitia besnoiti TaxID=94643 RepID=A0A2A9MP00_BESBE|nr:sodium/hydrogen exchanger 3 protein [Besnoitia besnoiti]PFH37723.1 sodium/hydrogen exchanger 3 protein [Besnoitia besnoiti]
MFSLSTLRSHSRRGRCDPLSLRGGLSLSRVVCALVSPLVFALLAFPARDSSLSPYRHFLLSSPPLHSLSLALPASASPVADWVDRLPSVPFFASYGNSTWFSLDGGAAPAAEAPPAVAAASSPTASPAPGAGAASEDKSAASASSAGAASTTPRFPSAAATVEPPGTSPAASQPPELVRDEAAEAPEAKKEEEKSSPSKLATAAPAAPAEGLAASFTNVNMLLLALCLLCCFGFGYLIHMNVIRHLPDSGAAMLIGFVFGLLARVFGPSAAENSFLHFDPQFFYFVLLPPIVLEAGFCLNKAAFVYNLGPILMLSIAGTILSAFIIAQVTFATAHISGLEGPAHEIRGFSWAFASLISATDTVATLSIIGSPKFRLGKKGVDLYSILMGESVLNDAVSIALTRSVLKLFFTAEAVVAQRASGIDVIADFVSVVVGSLIIGLGLGAACCFCFRHSQLRRLPEYEVAITLLTAYMAFGVSEWLGFSGVVSLFFCGVMLGHFNMHNLSKKSRYSIDIVFKTIALISEKTVFAYLGVVAAIGIGERAFNICFILISLSACAISRVACVFPLCFISNRFRREEERIDFKQQILMWLAGLRGAVAFALAMTIPCSFDMWRAVCRHNKDLVITTTLVLVAVTTLGVGSVLEYSAVKLGTVQRRREPAGGGALLPHSPSGAEGLLLSSASSPADSNDEGAAEPDEPTAEMHFALEDGDREKGSEEEEAQPNFDASGRPLGACIRFLYRLDREYLQRWFGRDDTCGASQAADAFAASSFPAARSEAAALEQATVTAVGPQHHEEGDMLRRWSLKNPAGV